MAVARRKTRRRAAPATAAKTNRRRPRARANKRHVTVVNRRRGGLLNPRRNRRRNPVARHNRRRRHNPPLKGVVEIAVAAGVGMALTDLAQGFVPASITSSFGGPVAKIGVRLGLAYLVGLAAEKFGFAKYSAYLAAGGAVGAFQDALRLFVGGGGMLFPAAQVVQAPAAPPGPGQAYLPASSTGDDSGGGMNDIVYYPYGQGMSDIVYAPGPQGNYQ